MGYMRREFYGVSHPRKVEVLSTFLQSGLQKRELKLPVDETKGHGEVTSHESRGPDSKKFCPTLPAAAFFLFELASSLGCPGIGPLNRFFCLILCWSGQLSQVGGKRVTFWGTLQNGRSWQLVCRWKFTAVPVAMVWWVQPRVLLHRKAGGEQLMALLRAPAPRTSSAWTPASASCGRPASPFSSLSPAVFVGNRGPFPAETWASLLIRGRSLDPVPLSRRNGLGWCPRREPQLVPGWTVLGWWGFHFGYGSKFWTT